MEKEIDIKDKKVKVTELSYLDAADLADSESSKDKVFKMFKSCTNLSEEDIKNLNIEDGKKIENAISEINGISSETFQNPTEKNE